MQATSVQFAARAMARLGAGLAAAALAAGATVAQEPYKRPPQQVVDLVDAPPPPIAIVSPTRTGMLLVDYEAYPSITLLARPFHKLGGLRVDPALHSLQRLRQHRSITVKSLPDGSTRPVPLPTGAAVQLPQWSYDGRWIAFARDVADGVELWVADAATGAARVLSGVRLNDVLGAPFVWRRDNRHLLVRTVPAGRGPAPAAAAIPAGPNVQETAGKRTRMATYRDLLADAHDEDLFAYYGESQLALVDAEGGGATPLLPPGLYTDADFSPDGRFLLVTRLERPFSFRVPYSYFTRTLELWHADGTPAGTFARLRVADEVPQQGVPVGPRDVQWQPLRRATLVWVEALDGGDPLAKVPHRDRLLRIDVAEARRTAARRAGGDDGADAAAPGAGSAAAAPDLAVGGREALRLEERLSALRWTARADQALVTEYDRDRRWNTTWLVDLSAPQRGAKKVFDLSARDSYHDPGNPVWTTRPDGEKILLQDGDWIYWAGRGATDAGDRPFLDRLNLKTLRAERLFRSDATSLESFAAFGPGNARQRILTSRESRTEPPNWYLLDLGTQRRTKLTDYRDPAPQLSGIDKRLLRYHRGDGVPLSGFLYLPPGYRVGTRLPVVLWAYPLEYSDAGTAGQVRGSPNTFVRLTGDSPLFFLTEGYAVLQDAAMPVIGDPETMNDTYVEQIVAAAKAAIDTLAALGVADRDRVCIAGHSYGAFMTANLLAHSDLFAAGIARSGAYNRSLTPFGFQAERRSYWEATDVYTRISPFTYAHKIGAPLLLIHGEEDNNSGTFPIQSERLFQAIQANGGTSRLVLLPHESHGYRSRESVLHVLAEMFEWCDRYVKNPPPRGASAGRAPR